MIGRSGDWPVGRLALAGNGDGPAAKCFKCEENIHDSQARNRSAHKGLFTKKRKPGERKKKLFVSQISHHGTRISTSPSSSQTRSHTTRNKRVIISLGLWEILSRVATAQPTIL